MFKPHIKKRLKHRGYAVGTTHLPGSGQIIFGGLANAPLDMLDQIIGRPSYEIGTESVAPEQTQAVEKTLDTFLNSVIPVKVQQFIKANQNTPITSLQVGRTPIKQWINTALNIMSAGAWNTIKKQVGYDSLYHLYLIVNGKYVLEKNEVYNVKAYSPQSGEEKIEIPIAEPITIGEMFSNVKNAEQFYSNYNAFGNNCQDATLYLLQQNNRSFDVTSQVKRFIKQDLSSLLQNKQIQETGKVVKKVTNIGATINKLLQYVSGGKLSFARGGIVRIT